MVSKRVAVVGDRTTTGGTIIQGLNTFNVNGKGVALDGYIIACGCPGKSHRIIASLSMIFADDTQQNAPAAQPSTAVASSFVPPALHQSIAPQSAKSLVDNKTTVEPVFAKSCLRGSGCTDAGTAPEPADNFGGMAFYQAATFGVVANTGTVTALEAAAATLRYLGGIASKALPGRLMTPNPVIVGLVGIFYSSGLNSGEQDYFDQKKLEALATQGGNAPTRVRFQWVQDSTTGKMAVKGYHTNAGEVPVKMMKQNASTGFYEFGKPGHKDRPYYGHPIIQDSPPRIIPVIRMFFFRLR